MAIGYGVAWYGRTLGMGLSAAFHLHTCVVQLIWLSPTEWTHVRAHADAAAKGVSPYH